MGLETTNKKIIYLNISNGKIMSGKEFIQKHL
jgi:hypothetical protein